MANNQHRNRSNGIPGHDRGQDRESDGDGHEPEREAISESKHGRTRLLRLAHQPQDARVRALGGDGRGPQVERTSGVDTAAADRVSRRTIDQRRLTRQRRFIENCMARDGSVDGYDLAGCDEEHIVATDVIESDTDHVVTFHTMNVRGSALEQCSQLTFGAG